MSALRFSSDACPGERRPAMSPASDFPPACDPVHGCRTAGRPTGAAGWSRRAPFGFCVKEVGHGA